MKTYKQVKIDDRAYSVEDPEIFEGHILWKGSYSQLKQSKYADTSLDWEDYQTAEEIDEYDLVVVSTEFGPTLFNYNNDPCGVFCK